MTAGGSVTPEELAARMGIPPNTVRWHCREPRGLLYGAARLAGRHWLIDAAAADRFARTYVRRPSGRRASQ